MKKFNLLLLFAFILLLVGCSSTKKDSSSEKLVVYTPNSEGLLNAVIPSFEEETGIKVEIISAGTGELFKRLDSEKADPYADVIWGGSYALYANNIALFEEYTSKENDNVIEAYQNKTGYISPFTVDGSVIIINKTLTKDIKIEGYEDLLNPLLKGKIASADPANSSSAFAQLTNILLAMGGYENDKSWDYVSKLVVQLDGKIASGSSSVYKSVADGEMSVGLSYEDPSAALLRDGADVALVFPKEGAVFLPAGMSIVKGAKNDANAQKFIDFVLSKETQNSMGMNTTNRPVRSDATLGDYMSNLDNINVIEEDMKYVEENRDSIIKKYLDIFESLQ
ncbi:MAG: ABC transporter substrate-binding protein [Bacilli bacterium]